MIAVESELTLIFVQLDNYAEKIKQGFIFTLKIKTPSLFAFVPLSFENHIAPV